MGSIGLSDKVLVLFANFCNLSLSVGSISLTIKQTHAISFRQAQFKCWLIWLHPCTHYNFVAIVEPFGGVRLQRLDVVAAWLIYSLNLIGARLHRRGLGRHIKISSFDSRWDYCHVLSSLLRGVLAKLSSAWLLALLDFVAREWELRGDRLVRDASVVHARLVDLIVPRLHLIVAAYWGEGEAVEDRQRRSLLTVCVTGLDGLRPMLLIPHFNN